MRDFWKKLEPALLVVNSQGLILSCNFVFEKLSGYKRDEVENKKYIDEIFENWYFRLKSEWGYEINIKKKDGDKLKVFLEIMPLKDRDLNVISFFDPSLLINTYESYYFFVSESPFPILELNLSELFSYLKTLKNIVGESFHKYVELYPEVVYEIIEKIRINYSNRSFLKEFHNFSFENFKSNLFNFLTETSLKILISQLAEVYKGNLNLDFEIDIIDALGSLRNIRCVVYPLGEERVVAYILDKTEEKLLKSRLQESINRLNNLFYQVINVLSSIMEHKDSYTAYHQKRVSKLAQAIGRKLRLSSDKIESIKIGALLHDIGKIAIPGEILNKPGKLNNIEIEIVKTHPLIGYDMLKNIDFAPEVLRIVLQHHERLDGSGYPEGLKNGEIDFLARIVAVADVVEAMISHRPYRPPLGVEKALEEIEKNKGIKYDEDVVDACIRLFREDGFEFSV